MIDCLFQRRAIVIEDTIQFTLFSVVIILSFIANVCHAVGIQFVCAVNRAFITPKVKRPLSVKRTIYKNCCLFHMSAPKKMMKPPVAAFPV